MSYGVCVAWLEGKKWPTATRLKRARKTAVVMMWWLFY